MKINDIKPQYDRELKVVQFNEEDLLKARAEEEGGSKSTKKKTLSMAAEFKLLPKKHKKKLSLILALTMLPIIAYCAFGISYLWTDKVDKIAEYNNTEMSEDQKIIMNKLETTSYEAWGNKPLTDPGAPIYSEVIVGIELSNISNVSNGSGSFDVEAVLWFDYNEAQFKRMVEARVEEEEPGAWPTGTTSSDEAVRQELYLRHRPARDGNYDLGGRGNFHLAFPVEYGTDTLYAVKDSSNIIIEERMYQSRKINATIKKKFDSPRFPLDSLQFKFFFRPFFDAHYMRYVTVSASNGEPILPLQSRLSPTHDIGGQYTLLGDDPFRTGLYFMEAPTTDPTSPFPTRIRTEFQANLIVNRKSPALFIQVFITLFAIVVWTFIALYDGAYNREFKLQTLGTSMFGIISAIIIGVSLMSEIVAFSLVNLVNIFGLAVVLISTIVFMHAKKVVKTGDALAIAANTIYVKMMFWTLMVATSIIFGLLPLVSFVW